MDEADRAQMERDFAEEHREHKWHPDAQATGYCLYCGVPIKTGYRWCDAEHAYAWSYERERKRVNGSPA